MVVGAALIVDHMVIERMRHHLYHLFRALTLRLRLKIIVTQLRFMLSVVMMVVEVEVASWNRGGLWVSAQILRYL